LETDIGETGRRLIEVSPLTVGLFTLLTSILLAGLAELLRTAEVIHPWSVHASVLHLLAGLAELVRTAEVINPWSLHSSDLHPLGWPSRVS
jgi:hypothetical protein